MCGGQIMTVTYEKLGRIVKITLNRPKAMNAFNKTMHEELNSSFIRFREDPEAWVAVVTGAGGRAFSAGADIKELTHILESEESMPNLWDSFFHIDLQCGLELYKPIVAAVNGYCIGEGLTLVMACDLRIAAESATFAFPEVVVGTPTIEGAMRATQIMGLGHALELLLMGERKDAAWAFRTGLVNEVVPDAKLQEKAMDWAERLSKVGPIAARCTKEVAIRSQHISFHDAVRMGEAMRRATFSTEDTKEGFRAFLEKRKPVFKGR